MSMNESVAYLKGLAQGLELDGSTKEGKLLTAILDVLGEMSEEIGEIEDTCGEQQELLELLDEDLGSLEEDFYEDDDDEDDECCGDLYEVTCPNCEDTVYLDEDMLLDGDMECPNCGQKLEFDLEGCDCENDGECDCGCKHE